MPRTIRIMAGPASAEAMLNDSIRLQPDNPIARQELDYIAELRAGAPTRDFTITAPNAPKPETQ